jgi:hypothetical protein
MRSDMRRLLIIAILLLEIIVAGCKQQSEQIINARIGQPSPSPSPSVSALLEPLYEGCPNNFREAWGAFTKDGRYRMAQPYEVSGMPYHYDWSKNVLVIVVDMARNDGDILKLAYFEAPKDEKGQYDLNWVIHNHNLSASRISNASSDLVVYEGGDPASKSSFLKWDTRRQKYTCLAK